jgi:hypothetical protein
MFKKLIAAIILIALLAVAPHYDSAQAVPPAPGGGGSAFPSAPGSEVSVNLPDYDRFLTEDANSIGYGLIETYRHDVNSYPADLAVEDVDGDSRNELVFEAAGQTVVLDQLWKKIDTPPGAENAVRRRKAKFNDEKINYEESAKKYELSRENLKIGEKTYKTSTMGICEEDIDGDGTMEIIVRSVNPRVTCVSHSTVFIFNAEGELIWNLVWPTWTNDIIFADFNGDGVKDIILADHSSNVVLFSKTQNPDKGPGKPRSKE